VGKGTWGTQANPAYIVCGALLSPLSIIGRRPTKTLVVEGTRGTGDATVSAVTPQGACIVVNESPAVDILRIPGQPLSKFIFIFHKLCTPCLILQSFLLMLLEI